jgi:hypothetical protein
MTAITGSFDYLIFASGYEERLLEGPDAMLINIQGEPLPRGQRLFEHFNSDLYDLETVGVLTDGDLYTAVGSVQPVDLEELFAVLPRIVTNGAVIVKFKEPANLSQALKAYRKYSKLGFAAFLDSLHELHALEYEGGRALHFNVDAESG